MELSLGEQDCAKDENEPRRDLVEMANRWRFFFFSLPAEGVINFSTNLTPDVLYLAPC
jgi:hypothetical protein